MASARPRRPATARPCGAWPGPEERPTPALRRSSRAPPSPCLCPVRGSGGEGLQERGKKSLHPRMGGASGGLHPWGVASCEEGRHEGAISREHMDGHAPRWAPVRHLGGGLMITEDDDEIVTGHAVHDVALQNREVVENGRRVRLRS